MAAIIPALLSNHDISLESLPGCELRSLSCQGGARHPISLIYRSNLHFPRKEAIMIIASNSVVIASTTGKNQRCVWDKRSHEDVTKAFRNVRIVTSLP